MKLAGTLRTRVPLVWRAGVFATITLIVLTCLMRYEEAGLHTGLYPPPNFLGSTWYGPFALLLIPLSLAWLSFGARPRGYGRRLGVISAVLVFLVCLLLIWAEMSAVGSLPLGIKPYGGWVR